MKGAPMRTVILLLVGVIGGLLTNTWVAARPGLSPPTTLQASSAVQGRGGPEVPDIAPVPNPPLYPDLQPATKPMHYSADYMRRIHEIRRAKAARGVPPTWAPGEPRIDAQLFRTHQLGVSSSGYGLTFRQKYGKPRPSQATGVMSYYDDADQHEGVTDFVIMVGGSGQFVVDGEIENREYGRDPRSYDKNVSPRNTGNRRVLLPGEFHGQPIRNGHVYETKAGDWLVVPPGVAHWWLPTAGEGMTYLILKVNIGLYPPALID